MGCNNTVSILASFATMKDLCDSKSYKNSYQLLTEFIAFIVKEKKLHSFTSSEMKNYLQETFGFEIPEAVVGTSANNLDFLQRENRSFIVNGIAASDGSFEKKKSDAESLNCNIVDRLESYIREKIPNETISRDALTQEFVAFLIDDDTRSIGRCAEQISQFVLENENDASMQTALSAIREGSILYIGLNHNINETGSIKKPLTLFLGTEVLFSLYGFNGSIYYRLANDFYEQIKHANFSEKKITLRYFSETKKEIDAFFLGAESIVKGENLFFNNTVAMKNIVNGCNTVGDIGVKYADFFHDLQYSFGIVEDDKTDYYCEKYSGYNLESATTDETFSNSIQLVSHINKLRKGRNFCSNIDSEFLLVTNNGNTLRESKNQRERDKEEYSMEFACDYAVSVDKITNLLWYKLGNGFGRKEYPCNVDAVLKARTLLATHISHNASKMYYETKKEFQAGKLTEGQLSARIITLRRKATTPEDLDADTIEEDLDFSLEYVSRFEEEVQNTKVALKEKDDLILTLESQNHQAIAEKNNEIAEKDKMLHEKEECNRDLKAELGEYRLKEEAAQNKRKKRENILWFIWSIVRKLLIAVVFTVAVIFVCIKIDPEIATAVGIAFGFLSLIPVGWAILKKDKDKYFPKDK